MSYKNIATKRQAIRYLVSYAGGPRKEIKLPTAWTMFRHGLNTFEIANRLGVGEHIVVKMITKDRSRAMGLPDPYKGESK